MSCSGPTAASGDPTDQRIAKFSAGHDPALAALYFRRMITLETAMGRSSHPEELQEIIARGPAAMNLQLQT